MEKLERYIKKRIGRIVLLFLSILISVFSYSSIQQSILDYPDMIGTIHALFVMFNIGVLVYLFKD